MSGSTNLFFKRVPKSEHVKRERRAAIFRRINALKAAQLPPREPVTSPAIRRKSRTT